MATWSKLFSNFAWKNRPDTSTPLGQTLLNRLNNAINGIDDRVVTLNAQKASTDDVNGLVANIALNEKTGVFTITRFNGTTFTINTALEEVVTNFKYDNSNQQLVLTLADGTTQNVDLSALITQYEFMNSATILWMVTSEGKVAGNIKPNSISDQMLQTNYLADITTQANTALSASQSALESQSLAEQSAEEADSQADRAKSEADRAKAEADRAEAITGINVDTTLDANSSNPIANKAVAKAFENVDAKTLDGHGAEYFAPKADLAKYLPLTGGTVKTANRRAMSVSNTGGADVSIGYRRGDTLLGEIGVKDSGAYYIDSSNKVNTILHTGNMADHVLPLDGGTLKRTARRILTLDNIHESGSGSAIGFSTNGTFLGEIGVLKDGTIVFNNSVVEYGLLHTGNMASHVLPLSGGTVSGAKSTLLTLENTSSVGCYQEFRGNNGKNGSLGFMGVDTPVMLTASGSANTLLHTGNMASHVLPLDVGSGNTVIKTSGNVPLVFNTTANGGALLNFRDATGAIGALGVGSKNNPVYSVDGTRHSILHTGNSARVHIGTSAPSDTSALWIDTSA